MATLSTEPGLVTSGRAKRACAFVGTSSNASTSGHTTGPPAENVKRCPTLPVRAEANGLRALNTGVE